MEKNVTFYTIIDSNKNLILVNESIVYSTSKEVLANFINNMNVFITETELNVLERCAIELEVDIHEIQEFGGTFKFQKLIIFGSDIIH
jgi:hypothetical protein